MANLTIKELIDAMKSKSAGMDDQDRKRNEEKISKLVSMSGEDTKKLDEIQKTNTELKKTFGKQGDINKSLQEMIKFYKTSDKELKKYNKEVLKKFDNLLKPQDRTKLGDIKYQKPITFKESMKEGVAGTKNFLSKVGGVGSGVLNTIRNPGQAINKAIGKAQDSFYGGVENVKDVLSTDKNYTAEAGRFGETYAKTDEGKKFGDKAQKMGEVGFNQLKAKEKEIADVESKIKEMKSQGFDPNKEDVEQLKSLKQQRSDLDIRNPSQINAAISPALKAEEKSQYAKVNSNQTPGFLKPLGNIGDKNEAGKSINAQDAAEAGALSKEESFLKQNPEGDNIQSANEKMADSLKELSLTSKDILIATRESVEILKSINKDLLGDNVQPLRTKEPGAGGAGAGPGVAAAEAPSLLDTGMDLAGDLLGRDKGKPKGFPRGKAPSVPGKGIGSKIMGGIKGIGGKVGGALKMAGRIAGKAALPLAVATAGYDAYQGWDKAGENFDLKQGEEATTGQKASSALGGALGMGGLTEWATGGLLNEKNISQGVHSTGSAISDFFTGGDKETSQKFPLKSEGTMGGLDPNDSDVAEFRRDAEDIKKYGSVEEIDQAVKDKKLAPIQRRKALRDLKSENPEAYQKALEKDSKNDSFQEFAKGGPVKGGGAENGADYIVGEEGPELFVPFKDGVVIPNDVSQKLAPAAIKGGLKGLAKGGIAYNDDGSYNKGNRTYSPSIGGFQKSVSNTGAETITADVGPISVTAEQDIYGNQRGASFTAPLTSDTTLEAGKLQAGSTIQYAKATGRDASGKQYNIPTGDLLSDLSGSNDSMRDEMSAKSGSSQPIIMNNSSNNSTTKIMPMKADPRPSSRGSALERHEERTSVY